MKNKKGPFENKKKVIDQENHAVEKTPMRFTPKSWEQAERKERLSMSSQDKFEEEKTGDVTFAQGT